MKLKTIKSTTMKTKKLWLSTIAVILLIAGSMVSCKDENVEVIGVCPEVVSTNPVNLATYVPLDQIITVTFNVEMDPATFTQASFSVQGLAESVKVQNPDNVKKDSPSSKKGERGATTNSKQGRQGTSSSVASNVLNTVIGTVTYSGLTATFTPSQPLEINTNYTATIEETVRDLMGNALQVDYVWTFSTGAANPPSVISTEPLNLETNVVLDKTISANFSQVMDPATITASTFTLMDGTTPVLGVVGYSGTTATFNPTSNLVFDKVYTATITNAATNLNGTAIAENYVWTFSTGANIAPTVISTDPVNLAVNVPIDKTISANFSMEMNPATITTSTFILMDGATPIAGVVGYTGTTATFNPTNNLELDKEYTATVTNGVTDLDGNAMATNYVWTFSTGAAAAPLVISTDPENLEINVLFGKTISATFNVVMNPLTITNSTFTLMDGATPVVGVVNYSGVVATFNPTANLLPGKTYTATITTGAQNEAGTALAANYVWSFTTQYSLTVNAVNGTVSKNPNQPGYNSGASVILTATPNSGYSFDSWSGDASGTDNPLTVIINGNMVITANFTENPPLGPGVVDLGTAGNFAILTKSGIDRIGTVLITGDIGVTPIDHTALTGFSEIMDPSGEFSTSIYVVGNIYAADYAPPTPTYVGTAMLDQETAHTTAMGLTTDVIVDLGAGDISGMTLAPGLYKFNTGLLITNQGVTLSGGPNDTWVFQIEDDFTVQDAAKITLAGGALAKNIFWITRKQALLGSTVEFHGNIVASTLISLNSETTVYGRLLCQTAATLISSYVIKPTN
jgi:uncharacterized repeat protein (TIGR02543 family)